MRCATFTMSWSALLYWWPYLYDWAAWFGALLRNNLTILISTLWKITSISNFRLTYLMLQCFVSFSNGLKFHTRLIMLFRSQNAKLFNSSRGQFQQVKLKKMWQCLETISRLIWAPNQEPVTLHIAIGMAIVQIILPFKTNKEIEPKLVAKLTNFA